MKRTLPLLRNIALAVFACFSLAQPVQAEVPIGCYNCGSCICCDGAGGTACLVACSAGYCDCCGGPGSCQGDFCN